MLSIQPLPISDKYFRFRLNFRQKLTLLTRASLRTANACNALQPSKIQAISSSDSPISGSDS